MRHVIAFVVYFTICMVPIFVTWITDAPIWLEAFMILFWGWEVSRKTIDPLKEWARKTGNDS